MFGKPINQIMFNHSFFPITTKKLIFSLVGSNIPVNQSVKEIKYFCEEKSLHTIITDDSNSIFTEINNYNPNVILHKSGILNCKEMENLLFLHSLSSIYTYQNYVFFIESNKDCNIDKYLKKQIKMCHHVDDVYPLDSSTIDKRNIINMYLY